MQFKWNRILYIDDITFHGGIATIHSRDIEIIDLPFLCVQPVNGLQVQVLILVARIFWQLQSEFTSFVAWNREK